MSGFFTAQWFRGSSTLCVAGQNFIPLPTNTPLDVRSSLTLGFRTRFGCYAQCHCEHVYELLCGRVFVFLLGVNLGAGSLGPRPSV